MPERTSGVSKIQLRIRVYVGRRETLNAKIEELRAVLSRVCRVTSYGIVRNLMLDGEELLYNVVFFDVEGSLDKLELVLDQIRKRFGEVEVRSGS